MKVKADFKTALAVVYRTRNSDEELYEPFLIYSRIADLIGDDYENKKKLGLFFAIEKRVNLFAEIAGGSNAKKLKKKYKRVSDLLSESAFNRLIDTLIESINENTAEKNSEIEEYSSRSDDSSENENDSEYVYNKVADGSEYYCSGYEEPDSEYITAEYDDSDEVVDEENDSTSVVPDNNDCNYMSAKDGNGSKVFAGCLFFLSVAVLALCGVLKTPWNAYRWIVGVTSMIIILVGSVAISEIIYEDVFNCVLLCIFAVANFVLWCVFRGNYYIVCYWVTPAVLVYGVYATVNAFDGFETACGRIDVGCCILTVGTLMLNIFL